MNLEDTARQALKDLPVTDVMRERVSLALDQISVLEKRNADLQILVGEARAELKLAVKRADKAERELETLRAQHSESVRIHRGIEFRRGSRTNGEWQPFCPKCHLPVHGAPRDDMNVFCSDNDCGWGVPLLTRELPRVIADLK